MSVDVIVTKFVQQGVGSLRGDLRAISGDMANAEGRIERLSDRLIGLGTAGAAGLAALGYASLKAHGDIQMAEIGFSKTLGSMDAAKKKIEELRQFDRVSPFSFQESVKGAMRLSAVGFEADQLKDVMTDIGDAAAGTGGTTDDFMGISRAIGQMRSKGKISMEEINQLGDRGVNALKILQQQLKFTDEQKTKLMQGEWTIESDVGVNALLKGFRELYGGAMMEASKTFPGQVSNLSSAVFQLGDAIGEILAADGTGLISDLTSLTDKTTDFVKNNPELAKTAFLLAGIGTSGAIAAGAYLKLKQVVLTTAAAKKALTVATKADTVAEAAKAVVAGREGAAITQVGKASDYSAGAAMRLADANAKAAMSAEKSARVSAKAAAKQKAIMSRLTPAQRLMVTAQRSPAGRWAGRGSAIGSVSNGMALGSAALGAAAGYGVSDDYGAMGDSSAAMKGAATGVATAAAAMFLPGAAIPIAIATGFRYAFNELVNRPMERIAEGGDPGSLQSEKRAKENAGKNLSLAERAAQAQMDAKELQRQADAMKRDGAWSLTGDRDIRDLEAQAESKRLQGLSLGRLARQDQRSSADGSRVSQWAPGEEARMRRENAERMRTLNQHNGETVIRIPNRPADVAYRNRRKASTSPVPRYA